jgi:hypothetical protein
MFLAGSVGGNCKGGRELACVMLYLREGLNSAGRERGPGEKGPDGRLGAALTYGFEGVIVLGVY